MSHGSNIPAIIVARMSSTRFPGKSLKVISGETLVGRVLSNVARSRSVDGYLVATSTDPTDNPIADWCLDHGVSVFRGSLANVALRVLEAGSCAGADAVVRVSGDSPFIDPSLIDHAIGLFQVHEYDLVTNVFPRSFPKGQSVEVISLATLSRVLASGLSVEQQEHVTTVFYEQPERFRIGNFTADDVAGTRGDHSSVQLSIDSEEDWATAEGVAQTLGTSLAAASWLDVERVWLHLTGGRAL